MISNCAIYLIVLCVSVNLVLSQVSLSLNSTLPLMDESACPNRQYVFTCRVQGSRLTAWSSIEYIGGGGKQLEFSTDNRRGDTVFSEVNVDVFANLTEVINDGTNIILESNLYLTTNKSSSVTCLTVSADSRMTIDFNVLGPDPPGAPHDAAVTEIPSDRSDCVLLVAWESPSDISQVDIEEYIVRNSRENKFMMTNQTLSTLVFPKCGDDIRVNISAKDVCGRDGQSTANIKPEFVSFTTNAVTVSPTQIVTESSSTLIAVTVVITMFGITNIIVIVIAVTLCFYIHHKRLSTKDENRKLIDKGDKDLKSNSSSGLSVEQEIKPQISTETAQV